MTPDLQVECPFCGCDSLVGSYGGKRLKCEGCSATAPLAEWTRLAYEQHLDRRAPTRTRAVLTGLTMSELGRVTFTAQVVFPPAGRLDMTPEGKAAFENLLRMAKAGDVFLVTGNDKEQSE